MLRRVGGGGGARGRAHADWRRGAPLPRAGVQWMPDMLVVEGLHRSPAGSTLHLLKRIVDPPPWEPQAEEEGLLAGGGSETNRNLRRERNDSRGRGQDGALSEWGGKQQAKH